MAAPHFRRSFVDLRALSRARLALCDRRIHRRDWQPRDLRDDASCNSGPKMSRTCGFGTAGKSLSVATTLVGTIDGFPPCKVRQIGRGPWRARVRHLACYSFLDRVQQSALAAPAVRSIGLVRDAAGYLHFD